MSGIESCGSRCVAYLFWVDNDEIFIGRLSVGLVDNLGDSFTHDNDKDGMVSEEEEMGNQEGVFKGHPDL